MFNGVQQHTAARQEIKKDQNFTGDTQFQNCRDTIAGAPLAA